MSCETFNQDEILFISGTYQVLEFNIYDHLGIEIPDLALKEVFWRMSKLCESTKVLEKKLQDGVSTSGNIITVVLSSSDTKNFSGFYTHQLILTDVSNKTYVIDGGRIAIKKMIK